MNCPQSRCLLREACPHVAGDLSEVDEEAAVGSPHWQNAHEPGDVAAQKELLSLSSEVRK